MAAQASVKNSRSARKPRIAADGHGSAKAKASPAPRKTREAKSDYVRARIETPIKHQAEAVLAAIGLTVSDAMRLMLVRVVEERKLPFDLLIPNEKTIAAILAARRGDVTQVASVDSLLEG